MTPKQAIEIQKQLRSQVSISSFQKPLRFIAGADVSMNRFSTEGFAGFIVLSYPDLQVVERAVAKGELTFPYIPGLLSFREIPILLEAWKKLKTKPDMVMVDGQGIAHPRRLGIATHLGLTLDVPTIGCAKSILVGVHEKLGDKAGDAVTLIDPYNKEVIGNVLRTKPNVKPVIISPGHNVSQEQALDIAKHCVRGYRLPEPTRLAHELVNQFRRGEIS